MKLVERDGVSKMSRCPVRTLRHDPGYILPACGHSADYSSSLLRRLKSLEAIPNLTVKTCKRTHKTAVTRMPVKGCTSSVVVLFQIFILEADRQYSHARLNQEFNRQPVY